MKFNIAKWKTIQHECAEVWRSMVRERLGSYTQQWSNGVAAMHSSLANGMLGLIRETISIRDQVIFIRLQDTGETTQYCSVAWLPFQAEIS